MTYIGKTAVGFIAIFLLCLLSPKPQTSGTLIRFRVKHDGQEKLAPDHLTLSFDNRFLQISVRDGKFEVPPEVIGATKVALAAVIDGNHIHITGISGRKFVRQSWTLLMAERAYSEDFQWVVPKDADIHSSCILAFDPAEGDGTAVFFPHCREP